MDNNNNKNIYIKTDNNTIINEKSIKWIKKMNKKMDDCLAVCTKSNGCYMKETHLICKINNVDSYNKLNKYFN